MAWQPPENYQPRPDLDTFLKQGSPPVGSALFKMVDYWQRRHPPESATIDEAWAGIQPVTKAQAQEAIDQRIVPQELYAKVLARAQP